MALQTKLTIGLLILGVLCLLIGAYSYFKPAQELAPAKAETQSKGTEFYSKKVVWTKSITVPATNMWFNTGIDVGGKEVRVAYESGKWKNAPDAWEADGEGCCPWPDLLVPNAPLRLVAKTDRGVFYVGNFHEGDIGDGILYLSINDKPGFFGDNTGTLNVKVSFLEREERVSTNSNPHPSYYPSKRGLPTVKPSVSISEDGRTCTIVVPADAPDGVTAVDTTTGREFRLNQGEKFHIEASGAVEFSSAHALVGPQGLGDYYDYSVDSPFHHNVGGLEFSIGPLGANRYFAGRYYSETAKRTGVPTFRIVESVNGYLDGNYGAFTVTVRKG